jgi:hypothetical protein
MKRDEGVQDEASPVRLAVMPEFCVTFDGVAAAELTRLAKETGQPVQALVEFAVGLLALVADAPKEQKHVMVATQSGEPLRVVAIPKPG